MDYAQICAPERLEQVQSRVDEHKDVRTELVVHTLELTDAIAQEFLSSAGSLEEMPDVAETHTLDTSHFQQRIDEAREIALQTGSHEIEVSLEEASLLGASDPNLAAQLQINEEELLRGCFEDLSKGNVLHLTGPSFAVLLRFMKSMTDLPEQDSTTPERLCSFLQEHSTANTHISARVTVTLTQELSNDLLSELSQLFS